MPPIAAVTTFLNWLQGKEPKPTTLDLIKAALAIATFAAGQVSAAEPGAAVSIKATKPMSKKKLATELEKSTKDDAAAAAIDWKAILAAILKLLPGLLGA